MVGTAPTPNPGSLHDEGLHVPVVHGSTATSPTVTSARRRRPEVPREAGLCGRCC